MGSHREIAVVAVADAVAVADVGVEEAGNVEDAGVVARIAVAGVVVVNGVHAFTGDGVGAKVRGVHWVLNRREHVALCWQSKVRVINGGNVYK